MVSRTDVTPFPNIWRDPSWGEDCHEELEAILQERRRVVRSDLQRCPWADAGAADEGDDRRVWRLIVLRSSEARGQMTQALQRVGLGRYGLCAECGVTIPPARLQAMPFAVRCLECQERIEAELGDRSPASARP